MRRLLAGLSATILLAAAGCSAPVAPVASTPVPAPAVTVTAIPQGCLDFIDDADALMELVREALGLASESMDAVANNDPDELDRINEDLDALEPRVREARAAYDKSQQECKAG